jgi:hypothetical protein
MMQNFNNITSAPVALTRELVRSPVDYRESEDRIWYLTSTVSPSG